jgi:hypothetical protein
MGGGEDVWDLAKGLFELCKGLVDGMKVVKNRYAPKACGLCNKRLLSEQALLLLLLLLLLKNHLLTHPFFVLRLLLGSLLLLQEHLLLAEELGVGSFLLSLLLVGIEGGKLGLELGELRLQLGKLGLEANGVWRWVAHGGEGVVTWGRSAKVSGINRKQIE